VKKGLHVLAKVAENNAGLWRAPADGECLAARRRSGTSSSRTYPSPGWEMCGWFLWACLQTVLA